MKDKLAAFENRDREAVDAKLLEEKKFEELLQNKDKELNEIKSQLELEGKNNKIEKLRNKISKELTKVNAIAADDALMFIKYDDLLDSEGADSEINNRVEELTKNKSYLFSGKASSRSETENGQPSGNSATNINQTNARNARRKVNPVLDSLTEIYKK